MFPPLCSITVKVSEYKFHCSSEAMFLKMSTGIRQYFSPTTRLPSHKDTGIGVVATREANVGVKCLLEKQASQQSTKKQKRYTNFADTDRVDMQLIVTMHVL